MTTKAKVFILSVPLPLRKDPAIFPLTYNQTANPAVRPMHQRKTASIKWSVTPAVAAIGTLSLASAREIKAPIPPAIVHASSVAFVKLGSQVYKSSKTALETRKKPKNGPKYQPLLTSLDRWVINFSAVSSAASA